MNGKRIIAIMGPSGVGKTTLGKNLSTRNGICIPRHCTTRSWRSDDQVDFYRYLDHEIYNEMFQQGKFLISSGDGLEIKKECGNFYGVLKKDCEEAWLESNIIILFVSYKDIASLVELKNRGIDIDIVNLTFQNIEEGVANRLINDHSRNHTYNDIQSRIKCAISDYEKYSAIVSMYASTTVYTDILDIEHTYEKVCTDLRIFNSYKTRKKVK